MPKARLGVPTLLTIYGGLALAAGLGISQAVALSGLLGAPERGQTTLEQRVANAREIQKALHTPLPPLEPLPPISTKVAGRNNGATAKADALSPEARAAMAEARPHTVWAAWCSTNPMSCRRPSSDRTANR